ncbi:MAG: ABC transporter ATP-binding protein/permease [Eubacteriaceae bacterium]|nr:ABC transporter ATP-binding protein/permease [Eubacteriaceae bacterium]
MGILMPKIVLDQIAAQAGSRQFIPAVGGIALLLVLVNFLKAFTDSVLHNGIGTAGINTFLIVQFKKWMEMDYELMEDPTFRKAQAKADKAMLFSYAPAMNIPRTLAELLSNSISFLLYAWEIGSIHPLILLLLLLSAAVNWLMLRRAREYMSSTRDIRSGLFGKLMVLNDILRDPGAAKDVRLFGASGWLSGIYRAQYAAYLKEERKLLSKNMHAQLANTLMILLRDGASYAFLIWLVLNSRMTLGNFVFVFAAIGSLADWVSGILAAASDLHRACIELVDIRVALDYPDQMNIGPGIPLPSKEELPPSIEFHGVSYTYPEADRPALSSINLTIGAGERIAVVGANGAGKTTLVKLICGLYTPTEGEVLLNGNPVGAYNRDEYYTLFSTVFQDIHMLSASIAENISQKPPSQTDREKVSRCLELTGLIEKTDSLPDKEDSLLVRAVHADAIELSGGERQKLAMSRALYKDAPVIVLDEPTAALDPIAENEAYQRYAELTEGKTSVYISHRLASTRFCDRILLLDGSVVAEVGTHDELMALDGIYARMFRVQASYYQEQEYNKEEAPV